MPEHLGVRETPHSWPGNPSLVIVADEGSFLDVVLVEAAVRAARNRDDVEVVAVCDTARRSQPRGLRPVARLVAASCIKRLFDPAHPIVLHRPMLESLEAIARRARVQYVTPPARDINHPDFVAWLRDRPQPTFALVLGSMQILRPPVLGEFERVVNYHNSLLPSYRGLGATAWSVYRAEPETGFTFHLMTDGIDQGPILLQGAVPIRPGASVLQLEWEKTARAAASIELVLELMLRGEPGREQEGRASYFGRRELEEIQAIDDPARHTWEELARRIRAFGVVTLRLGGSAYEVTRLRQLGDAPGRPGLCFTTSDGVAAEPCRFLHLPLPLYRLYEALSRTGGR